MARHIIKLIVLLLLVFPASALADDTSGPATGGLFSEDYLPAQHFTLKQDISMYMGYRFAGGTGSLRAAQYDYLHSSPAGGLSLHYYPLPMRFDVDFNFKNQYDYDAAVGIDYSDILKLDYRHMNLFHNLDHQRLIFPGALDRDPDERFGVKVGEDEVKLVIKSPGRPYHLYVNLREFRKDGSTQARWMPIPFFGVTRSQERDIDWTTRELTAGINGNVLGLFELDYHHTIKTFDSGFHSVLGPDTIGAKSLLHNRIPDIESNTDTIMIHSDQSKPLAASGTFSWGDKVNRTSGAKVDFHREYGDVTYRPLDNLFVAVKYGHQRLDVTNPKHVADSDFAAIPVTTVAAVPNGSISTVRDRGTVSVSYYPVPKLFVLGEYQLDSVDKARNKEWALMDQLNVTKNSSITHTGKITLNATPFSRMKLRAGFTYSHTGDPERNVNCENSYEGFASANWAPVPGLNVNAQCNIMRGDNPVRSEVTNTEPIRARNMHVEKDSASAGVSWFAHKGLVLGAHYDYLRFKVAENLIYELNGVTDMYTFDSPYNDSSHSYSVFGNYCFEFPLKLEATFSQIWTMGNYRTDDFLTATGLPQPLAPPSGPLANLTDQKTRETRATFKAQYDIWKGWGTAICYGISQFSDLANVDRPVAGMRNGTAHSGSIMLTKKW